MSDHGLCPNPSAQACDLSTLGPTLGQDYTAHNWSCVVPPYAIKVLLLVELHGWDMPPGHRRWDDL
jgi:hypothetical protein